MSSKLEHFLLNPYDFINTASINELIQIAKQADIAYYNNDEPIMSDDEYDLIRDRIKEINPNNKYLLKPAHQAIKATQTVTNKEKTLLPYAMGSMNKLKPQDIGQINTFINTWPGPWVISDKLDGISALYILEPDKPAQLYTRGNGTIGTIITNLISLINIAKPHVKTKIVVRGELIMKKNNFKKYMDTMANARNMVAGIVNAKTIDKIRAKDIDFVAYEMIEPWNTYTNQFEQLKKLKFNVVHYTQTDDITVQKLSETLLERKNNSEYECDGIIVSSNSPTTHVLSGNPDYAFAFKNLAVLETALVKVKEVEWNISKDKYMKPKLILEPTKLSGVTIKNVTGFNAKYIFDNCLGPGAEIKLIRSGDVIPHILEVTKPATTNIPQLPPEDTYEWNETQVDIIAVQNSKQHRIKELTYFCSKINISNLSEGNINKMIDAGIDTIGKILSVTKEELATVEGFKNKMIEKIYTEIYSKVQTMNLIEFMTGSNTFGHGMGEKKITKILNEHPDIIFQYIEKNDTQLIEQINQIEGFDTVTSTQFVTGMKKFLELLNTVPDEIQQRLLLDTDYLLNQTVNNEQSKLKGIKIVFSGFRNKEWEKIIQTKGGEVSTSVSGNTKIVVSTKEDIQAKTNSKIKKAFDLGIQLMDKETFETQYMKNL